MPEAHHAQVALIVGDRRGKIVYANLALAAMSGFTQDELERMNARALIAGTTPSAVLDDQTATLRRRVPWSGMLHNVRQDGERYWVRANVMPLWEDGAFVGSLMVLTPPTEPEVEYVAPLYERLCRGDKGLRVQNGEVADSTFASVLAAQFGSAGITGRAWLTTIIVAVAAASATWLGLSGVIDPFLAGGMIAGASGFAAHLLARSVVRPLRQAIRLAHELAACDLTQGALHVRESGELGDLMRALGQAAMNVRATVGDVRDSAAVIRSAVKELADGTAQIAAHTESQASSLEETAASIEEMTSAVAENARSCAEATRLAQQAFAAAELGSTKVKQVAETMSEISTASKRISELNTVIDAIAFQTNILALNAAVEAARAGEHGRGFTVIAHEVRALALQSADAARQVKALVGEGARRVATGTEVVRETGAAMDDIAEQIGSVRQTFAYVENATAEQRAGIVQINEAMALLDQMTQGNAHVIEGAASAGARLSERADRLVAAASVFRLFQVEKAALREAAGEVEPVEPFGAGLARLSAKAPASPGRPHTA